MTDRIGAVIVHHGSYDTVGQVVLDLIAEGISAEDILVVDNSVEVDREVRLRSVVLRGVRLLFTTNRGYGAAVNDGVRSLEQSHRHDYVVIATHEVRIRRDTVSALERAFRTEPKLGAAGPTLMMNRDGRDEIWSTGGFLTRWAKVPRHWNHRMPPARLALDTHPISREREWLDGAFVMYRTRALLENPINELFFMYVEEVDLHLRLRRAGYNIAWVPDARVQQSSAGAPAYYFARNLVLLHRLHRQVFSLALSPLVVLRAALPQAIRVRSVEPLLRGLKGLMKGFTERLDG